MNNADNPVASSYPPVKLNCAIRPNGMRKERRPITPEEMAKLPPNSRYIVLACGTLIIVDEENYDELSKTSWSLTNGQYASSRIDYKLIYMHRLITGAQPGDNVDRRNNCTYDNRRENLRICDRSQNMCNKRKQSNNTSGHVGVSWFKQTSKWRVQVKVRGVTHSGGYYDNVEDAIKARAELAAKLHGSFAKVV